MISKVVLAVKYIYSVMMANKLKNNGDRDRSVEEKLENVFSFWI